VLPERVVADGQFMDPLLPRVALASSRNIRAIELTHRLGLDSRPSSPLARAGEALGDLGAPGGGARL